VLLPTAAACHFNQSSTQTSGGSVRIGIINSVTGARAPFGQGYQRGYAMALEEINAAGGVLGKPLELDIYDDQGKPDISIQGASKLVDQDHLPVVIGYGTSEDTLGLVPAMTGKQVPFVVASGVADNIIELKSPWVFRMCAGTADIAAAVVDFLRNHGAPKTMAVVYENSNFGQSTAVTMRKAAAEGGIAIVDEEAYNAGAQSYSPMLQRVKEKKPETLFFVSYLNDATALMRQSRQIGLDARLFMASVGGFSTPEFPTEDKGAGKDAEYTIAASQWVPQAKWAGSREFDEKFVAKYGSHPAYHAMHGYAALKVVAAAIEQAKKLEPTAIRDALRGIRLDTAYGPIHFADNGQNEHPVFFTQVQKGKHTVVWPKDLAAAPVLETPPWSAR
jgi:branched-chain amino acid transport system substrate-binding protein